MGEDAAVGGGTGGPSGAGGGAGRRPALRTIAPKGARIVAWSLFALVAAGTAVFVVVAPRVLGADRFPLPDQVLSVLFGALVCWGIYRQATVRIVPRERDLRVRNVFSTTTLAWEQVVAVRFGPDHPWARLDLADGSTLGAMGIQTSDGEYAGRQARYLATLVALHEPEDH